MYGHKHLACGVQKKDDNAYPLPSIFGKFSQIFTGKFRKTRTVFLRHERFRNLMAQWLRIRQFLHPAILARVYFLRALDVFAGRGVDADDVARFYEKGSVNGRASFESDDL